MRRAYKFRLYPNKTQEQKLGGVLETHRRLYNTCLDQRKTAYETEKRSVNYNEQSSWFKEERRQNPYFALLNFSSAQATMRRLDKAFRAFFRRVKAKEKPGYPRFKGKERLDSITFPAHGDGIRFLGNKLRVQHVGLLRVKNHREVYGEIKTLTIKREAGKWYLILSCEIPDMQGPRRPGEMGGDVGLEAFLTTSEGEREPNPRYLQKELLALRRLCRAVSRKKKGGKNRYKAARRLSRLHARVKNLRREHHISLARKLVRRYGFIVVEALIVANMVRNRRLARAIMDAGWSQFLCILRGKAEEACGVVVAVDPRYSSQECSSCGRREKKKLSERWHECPCGCRMHRDENAARVILARGLRVWSRLVELNLSVGSGAPRSRLLCVTKWTVPHQHLSSGSVRSIG